MIRAVSSFLVLPLLFAFVLAAPSPSAAQTRARARARAPADLSWDAPAECPSIADVRPRIDSLEREAAKLSVRGRIEHRGDHYTLNLDVTTRGESGSRTLEDASCSALVDAAMVVLELSLAPKEDVPKQDPTPPREPVPEPAPRATLPRLTIGAALTGDVGTLSRPALGVLGSGALRLHRHVGVEILATYLPPVTTTAGSVGVSVQTVAASALGCYLTEDAPLVFGACAGITLGGAFGAGEGARNGSTSGSGWLVAPLIASHVQLHVAGPLGITLGLTAALPIERPRFVMTGVGALHEVGRITGSAYLGPSLTF